MQAPGTLFIMESPPNSCSIKTMFISIKRTGPHAHRRSSMSHNAIHDKNSWSAEDWVAHLQGFLVLFQLSLTKSGIKFLNRLTLGPQFGWYSAYDRIFRVHSNDHKNMNMVTWGTPSQCVILQILPKCFKLSWKLKLFKEQTRHLSKRKCICMDGAVRPQKQTLPQTGYNN